MSVDLPFEFVTSSFIDLKQSDKVIQSTMNIIFSSLDVTANTFFDLIWNLSMAFQTHHINTKCIHVFLSVVFLFVCVDLLMLFVCVCFSFLSTFFFIS